MEHWLEACSPVSYWKRLWGQMLAGVKDMVFYFRPVGWDYPYLLDIPEGYATWYTFECRGENAFCYVLSTLKSELPESRIAVIMR